MSTMLNVLRPTSRILIDCTADIIAAYRANSSFLTKSLHGYQGTSAQLADDLCRMKDPTGPAYTYSADASNEYAAVTVKWDTLAFTVIAAYIPPRATFDVDRLQDIIDGTPGPHILTGDFNAHHPAWGGRKTSVRGRRLFDIAHRNNLAILNDGQPTFFKNDRCSALDVTMISAHLMSTATWFADIESHGSDHVPTYISLGCPKQYTQQRVLFKYGVIFASQKLD
ncbi:hypothetical protein HPB52_010198 [Rhipicephalus sanguineus]|uniref:Endonuclease/exonuclease/phosphatase domain-containing protein n=1 Tax=Rhipicephalus sanguineus TaxID=34632 RepID=A0A9D4PWN0_RHISA|nr:hypothetical protein HPB52_010198 [Rhipicephalus sanguineus]